MRDWLITNLIKLSWHLIQKWLETLPPYSLPFVYVKFTNEEPPALYDHTLNLRLNSILSPIELNAQRTKGDQLLKLGLATMEMPNGQCIQCWRNN